MKWHDTKSSASAKDRKEPPFEFEALKEDLARVRADLASISSNLFDRGKHAIQDAGSDVGNYAQNSAKHVQEFVREWAFSTALVSLSVGVLVGVLIKKR